MADGLPNSEIADRLHLSIETIRTHSKRIKQVLTVRSRTHAVAIGLRRGLVE